MRHTEIYSASLPSHYCMGGGGGGGGARGDKALGAIDFNFEVS